MITSTDNPKLKLVRKLRRRRERARSGLFVAESEDLVAAAAAAGFEPELLLRAGVDVEPRLLAAVSSLGSGARVLAVYRQRWSDPASALAVYLHGVRDPGNVGAVIRSTHALADGPAILGPGCADPWSAKAVQASMGSIFARPPARARPEELRGALVALDPGAERELSEIEVEPPLVLCLGAEREGLPEAVLERARERVRIPLRSDGPQSLNVAMAAAIALYDRAEAGNRMADRA